MRRLAISMISISIYSTLVMIYCFVLKMLSQESSICIGICSGIRHLASVIDSSVLGDNLPPPESASTVVVTARAGKYCSSAEKGC